MQSMANAGAIDLVVETVAAGARRSRTQVVLGELARRSTRTAVELSELPITPVQVANLCR